MDTVLQALANHHQTDVAIETTQIFMIPKVLQPGWLVTYETFDGTKPAGEENRQVWVAFVTTRFVVNFVHPLN